MKALFKKLFPSYLFVPIVILIFSNLIVYYGSKVVNTWLARPYIDMTGVLERATPVVPWFAIIYVAAFPFWYISYYLLCRSDKNLCHEIVLTDVIAKITCGFLFILIPTTNVRPEIVGSSIGEMFLRYIYLTDTPYNLFPSVHCLESWLCFSYIRDSKVHVGVKIAVFILAVAICLSTVFTVQHVWLDVFAGVLMAEFFKAYVPYISGVMSATKVQAHLLRKFE